MGESWGRERPDLSPKPELPELARSPSSQACIPAQLRPPLCGGGRLPFKEPKELLFKSLNSKRIIPVRGKE